MAKQFRDNSNHFDSDLDAILNRVYGAAGSTSVDQARSSIRSPFVRHDQGSQDLKQALADLRDRREKSQSVMRMKEEVEYLQDQIRRLRDLTDQIDSLRQRLDTDADR